MLNKYHLNKQCLPDYLAVIEDPWYQAVAVIQNKISCLSNKFFEQHKIRTLHLPVTTGSISSPMGLGSDSKPVEIDLFGVKTYLADSMQFMLEYGCRLFQGGCYYLMPSFRGEEVDERHLSQFYHCEAEIPGDLDDVMNLVDVYIQFLSSGLLDCCKPLIMQIVGSVAHLERAADSESVVQIKFDDAIRLLDEVAILRGVPKEKLYKYVYEGTRAFTNLGEKILIEIHGGMLWVTHYDQFSAPFYQSLSSKHDGKVNNADLLFGIGEVVGAGERHINDIQLLNALKSHHVEPKEYEWYINMKRHYPIKTSGFGMGVERFILWVLNHQDIRDCQIFKRENGRDILP